MKTLLISMSTVVSVTCAWVLGWTVPLLAATNLVWLLVKDETLVRWTTIGWLLLVLVAAVIYTLASMIWFSMQD